MEHHGPMDQWTMDTTNSMFLLLHDSGICPARCIVNRARSDMPRVIRSVNVIDFVLHLFCIHFGCKSC